MFASSAIKIAVIATVITALAVGGIVGIIIAVTDVADEDICRDITAPTDLVVAPMGKGKVVGTWTHSTAREGCTVTYNVEIFEDGVSVSNETTKSDTFSYSSKPCTVVKFSVVVVNGADDQKPIEAECPTEIGAVTGITIDDYNLTVSWDAVGKQCLYEISIESIDDIINDTVEDGNSFDLSPLDLQICVDYTVYITPVSKDGDKGEIKEETFQLAIGEVEDFEFDKYKGPSGSKIKLSFTKVPECSYDLYFEDKVTPIPLDDSKCTTNSGTSKATCSVDPSSIDVVLATCMIYTFTMKAYSVRGTGETNEGDPTSADLVVTTPGLAIPSFEVTYHEDLYTSIATWDDLGPVCAYKIAYKTLDHLQVYTPYLEGGYKFENTSLVYCKNLEMELTAYSIYDIKKTAIASQTYKHSPGLNIPQLNVYEEESTNQLYANWTNLNADVCLYSVVLTEQSTHEAMTRNNWKRFVDTTAKYCQAYKVQVTASYGTTLGEPREETYHKDPEKTSVAVTNVVPHIAPDNPFLVVLNWSKTDQFKECDITYTIKCAVNDGSYLHTDGVKGPPFNATRCKVDSGAKKFRFGIQPIINPNAVYVAEYTTECDINFAAGMMIC